MPSDKLISIIVPVYNVENYLCECLDSLIGQTYPNIEIVCVNDGSTDQSGAILESYASKDNRIKIISQTNAGLSEARNSGLKHASGDYIMFVDSDDWVDLNVCEKAIEENVDVVFWSYYREYDNKSLKTQLYGDEKLYWDEKTISQLHKRMVGLSGIELRNPAQTDSLITLWGKLYKRVVLEGIEFVDTDLIGSEDTLFSISVFFYVKTAAYLPNLHYHYRKTNQSSFTSRKYKKDHVHKWRELYRRIAFLLDEYGADDTFYKALENRRALGIIQLGMMISSDTTMSISQKVKELRQIMSADDYKTAIKQIPISNMPLHWKLFFVIAKLKAYHLLVLLLAIMNGLRSKY